MVWRKNVGKELPKYEIVLQNDEVNPVGKVILALNLFAGLTLEESTKLTLIIHEEGSATIGAWHKELAETIMSRLNGAGLNSIMEAKEST